MISSEATGNTLSAGRKAACYSHVAPVTYGYPKTLADLGDVFEAAQCVDWDGEGSYPVPEAAYREAYRFIRGLRPFVEMPEVDASPTGGILLLWHAGPSRRLSVLLRGSGSISYAALAGRERHKGTLDFSDNMPVPPEIVRLIKQVES